MTGTYYPPKAKRKPRPPRPGSIAEMMATLGIPKPGEPSGMLAAAAEDLRYRVAHHANGTTAIPLDGSPGHEVMILSDDYKKLTADCSGHRLTRRRWFLDEAGQVRAYSRHDQRMVDGLLVAALILGATDGDLIEIDDPLSLLPGTIRKVS